MIGTEATPALRSMIERSQGVAAAAAADPETVPSEHCGLCGLPIAAQHRHVIDLAKREILCACQACSVLFDHSAAGGRHYRLLPRRRLLLARLKLDDLDWRALGIPVEVAFFVRDSGRAAMTAYYPSPAGVTESQLALDAWDEIERRNPSLAGIEPDVEALLINRIRRPTRAFVVGLEECFRLTAVVRQRWRGLGGGDEVWVAIERFFSDLEATAESES
jgi:hypothetical protein